MTYRTYLNSSNGFALVTVLLIISLLAVIGITLNRTSGLQTIISYNLNEGDNAYYIADAGVQHALFKLKGNNDLRGVIFLNEPFGTGSYTVSINDIFSSRGNLLISSSGKTGNAQKTVEQTILFGSTFTVQPPLIKDTFIDRADTDDNNGVSTQLGIGLLPGKKTRAMFEYDLSRIPAGSTIDSAVFELYMNDRRRNTSVNNFIDISVHLVTRSWNEGTKNGRTCKSGATWEAYDCVHAWTNFGGDFDSNVVTMTPVYYNDINQWHQWDIKDLVQSWVDDPSSNYGMLLQNQGPGNVDTIFIGYFRSDEYSDVSLRPKLSVTYTIP